MPIEFTRKRYLEVWRDDVYISRHTALVECAESASQHAEDTQAGAGIYEIRIGTEVWYEVRVMGLIAGNDLVNIEPPNLPPSWSSTPNPSFVDSTAGTHDLDQHTFDPEDDTLTYTLNAGSAAWPTGVSMDSAGLITATTSVVAGTTTGMLVDIDDGVNAKVTSPSFSVTVAATITDQTLRDLGYLLVDDYGADPNNSEANATATTAAINAALLDGELLYRPVWFSAGATYAVNDAIRLTTWYLNGSTARDTLQVYGGGSGATRPTIRLVDGASGFQSAGTPRPVVCRRVFNKGATVGTNPSDPMDQTGDWVGQANVQFDDRFCNFIIDCGDNPGAFGAYLPGAQRSFDRDIKVIATDALGGIWGLSGRNCPMMNIEIVGGTWGIKHDGSVRISEGSAGSMICGLKIVGDARMVTPFETDDFVPTTVVGFDITLGGADHVVQSDSQNGTGYATYVFIDGIVRATSCPVAAFDNTEGKTIYLRNIYVNGTNNLVKSETETTITGSGTWKRIDEYVCTDQTPTNAATRHYLTRSMINGTISTAIEPATSTSNSVAAPSVDYIARHTITVPQVDSGPFINIEDHGAVVESDMDQTYTKQGQGIDWDTPTNKEFTNIDSASAIQAAINAAETAGHNTVVIPRGIYYIGSTVNLKKDTILIGTGAKMSIIGTHGDWQPTSFTYMFTTPDDATGTCHCSEFGMIAKQQAGTGGGIPYTTPYSHDWFSWVHWRTGKNSSSILNVTGRGPWINPNNICNPKFYYSFSGNAGGKHYGGYDCQGDQFGHADCRAINITGTSQPMHLYGTNVETTKVSAGKADANVEIFNSSNVRLYGCKREGDSPTLVINDSTNIAWYGLGRQEVDPSSPHQCRITGTSNNVLIGICTYDDDGIAPTSREMILEDLDGQGSNAIFYPEGCSVYKRGTLDDGAATI